MLKKKPNRILSNVIKNKNLNVYSKGLTNAIIIVEIQIITKYLYFQGELYRRLLMLNTMRALPFQFYFGY